MENKVNTTGRRKEAVAKVFLSLGTGNIVINGKRLDEYFPLLNLQARVLAPLEVTENLKLYDVKIKVLGGGISGQAGAAALGIARALVETDEKFRATLKKKGLLKRDPRMVERKKYGRRKARKSPQYSKR
ncbi:MAG: 30S ribosomal protein S9 [Candidatus Omnitrophica bacterium]|nr:30S ribosomal protein S9 [Candidatus Omnitrophota bacterium]MBU1047097.1 30S ribosomal protein S9 [Candidatus Omnitrophota bacterium]MBU1631549.1 30S ribosomal protein S9 [Candidatus Omnitrophota bacterium]MBU1767715.1 30S ribosomal protein S9 [Candidatus Omnitrophota bacterium]MBU1888763.1 30S ribosomal protein S9 [Candidatus Omnitrophota bacterium]